MGSELVTWKPNIVEIEDMPPVVAPNQRKTLVVMVDESNGETTTGELVYLGKTLALQAGALGSSPKLSSILL